jgi:hypothetical protein
MTLGLHSTCFDEYYLGPLIRAANRVIDERLIVHSFYCAMHRTLQRWRISAYLPMTGFTLVAISEG